MGVRILLLACLSAVLIGPIAFWPALEINTRAAVLRVRHRLTDTRVIIWPVQPESNEVLSRVRMGRSHSALLECSGVKRVVADCDRWCMIVFVDCQKFDMEAVVRAMPPARAIPHNEYRKLLHELIESNFEPRRKEPC